MRVLLVGAAPCDPKWLGKAFGEIGLETDDFLLAVDGGVATLRKLKLTPDFAIGDWDSLGKSPGKAKFSYQTLPRAKDRSDFYFALEAALRAGAEEVICFGVTGGRPDHHLAALFDLAEISEKPIALTALDPEARYHFLSEAQPEIELHDMPRGATVSFFALGGEARGVTLEGFEYPLKNARLLPSSHGLSNEAKAKSCRVRLRSGRVVIVVLSG